MNFVLTRGQDFYDFFEFKNAQGRPIAMPSGEFKIVVEHGDFVREYTRRNNGLLSKSTRVDWRIPASETANFEYSTLYYTLYLDDRELARGVLKVQ